MAKHSGRFIKENYKEYFFYLEINNTYIIRVFPVRLSIDQSDRRDRSDGFWWIPRTISNIRVARRCVRRTTDKHGRWDDGKGGGIIYIRFMIDNKTIFFYTRTRTRAQFKRDRVILAYCTRISIITSNAWIVYIGRTKRVVDTRRFTIFTALNNAVDFI